MMVDVHWTYLSIESIEIHGFYFPKFIPDPTFLEEQELTYKRYFISCKAIFSSSIAPEYDQFKDLFRCHSLEADFYIVFPRTLTPVPAPDLATDSAPHPTPASIPAPTHVVKEVPVHSVNAFSSSYREEVEGFSTTLCALIPVMQTQKNRHLQTLISDSEVEIWIGFC